MWAGHVLALACPSLLRTKKEVIEKRKTIRRRLIDVLADKKKLRVCGMWKLGLKDWY
jgi:hypothetical protein